jgi:c-di-GMP-binding flagellar brake protein YcgR
MVERRRHERVAVRVPVYIVVENEVYQKVVEMDSRNVSEGGLSFETRRHIPLHAESLIVVARMSGLPEGAQIRARVVHSHWNEAAGLCTVGIRFDEFVSVTPAELAAHIDALKADRT